MKPRKYVTLILQYIIFFISLGAVVVYLIEGPYYWLVGFDIFMVIMLIWVNLKHILRLVIKKVRAYQVKKGIIEPRERSFDD